MNDEERAELRAWAAATSAIHQLRMLARDDIAVIEADMHATAALTALCNAVQAAIRKKAVDHICPEESK